MKNTKLYRNLQSWIAAGRFADALNSLNQYLNNHSKDLDALNLRAYVLLNMNQVEKAMLDIEMIFSIQPNNLAALKTSSRLAEVQGDLAQVIELCNRVLSLDDNCFHSRLRLARAYCSQGRVDESMALYDILLASRPPTAEIYTEYAEVLLSQGRFNESIGCYSKAVNLSPTWFKARFGLARALQNEGRLNEATQTYRSLVKDFPNVAEVRNNLGHLLQQQGHYNASIDVFSELISMAPDYIDGLINYGNVAWYLGRFKDAEKALLRVLEIDDSMFSATFNLANTYQSMGNFDKAIEYFNRSIKLNPKHSGSYNNLGNIYKALGQSGKAIECFERAIEFSPDDSMVYGNLGALYCDAADIDKSRENYEKALELNRSNMDAFTNYVYFLNYPAHYDDQIIYAKHIAWGDQFCSSRQPMYLSQSDRYSAHKRIRIGYVSGDFRMHSVAYFFQPLLENHNKDKFEIFCYSTGTIKDNVTESLKQYSDHWLDVKGLDDTALAAQILTDEIDILVDLAGHTAGNRLSVFGFGASPHSVNWLGYPNTTGIQQMEYRFTDEIADPVGIADDRHTEKLIRLGSGFLCYRGNQDVSAVDTPPCIANKYITFGSFNNITKITNEVIELWSKILRKVDGSKLLLKSKFFADDDISTRFYDNFAQYGIARDRIDLRSHVANYNEHMQVYSEVDVALDTFPYNGTTTTCEALWMGVPVITSKGPNHRSRVSASILSRLGAEDCIGGTDNDYIAAAVELASSTQRLIDYRTSLRSTMQSSDLCNESKFALTIEEAYEKINNNNGSL